MRAKREPEKHPLLSRRGRHEKGAARPFQTPKELSKHKNASRFAKRIFCTSPVYGSADGVTLQQNFMFCKGVKSAAKQQMGEAQKMRNSDDRRLRRIQGGAVGAAVSRTRVPLKARSGRWAPQPVLAQRLAFFRFDFLIGIVKGEQPLTRCGESGVQRQGGGSRNTPPCLWPARSASRLTERKTSPALPAREGFLVLFWHAKENISLNAKAI